MSKELGRGAASIFSGISQNSEVENQLLKDEKNKAEIQQSSMDSLKMKEEKQNVVSQQSIIRDQKMKEEHQRLDLAVLEQAIDEGAKYPKVTIYSPIIATFMRYMEIKTPRFKLSPEAETRLEKVLKREDPELWKAIEEKIQWKKRKR
jgi:hypothetical protein